MYKDGYKVVLAVDCIIFGFGQNDLKLLLVHRNLEPERGKWSLMGGFVKKNEDLEGAANRILEQLTGLKDIYMDQVGTFGKVDRDPAERVVSVAYYALINTANYNERLVLQHGANWFSINEIPDLVFDHGQMVDAAIGNLRLKARNSPIGFELLPTKFTLPQLQRLYEAIYQSKLDDRNFRKKILAMDILEKLDEKEKGSSRKGAWLYRFDPQKYQQSLRSGSFTGLR